MTRTVILHTTASRMKPEAVSAYLPDRVILAQRHRSRGADRRAHLAAALIEATLGVTVDVADAPLTIDTVRASGAAVVLTDDTSMELALRFGMPDLEIAGVTVAVERPSTLLVISLDAIFPQAIGDPDIVEQWVIDNSEVTVNRYLPGHFALGDWDIRLARLAGVVGALWTLVIAPVGYDVDTVKSRLPGGKKGSIPSENWAGDDVANDIRHAADTIASEYGTSFERIQVVIAPQHGDFVEQMSDRLCTDGFLGVPVGCHVTSRLGIEERDIQALVPMEERTAPTAWEPHETGGEPW
jgi:hypothetical protein